MRVIKDFLRDESGATAIEYALLASAIGVTLIAALNGLGGAISGKLNNIKNALN